jgi:hypothetical protein
MGKNYYFLFWILLLAPCISRSQAVILKDMERCIKPKFEEKCVKKTLPPSDYTYVSSWDYSSNDSLNIKFPVLLRKNISYVFVICDGYGNDHMILNLFDNSDKLLISSLNSKTKKNDGNIFFKPKASGKFYIATSFNKDEQNCCLIMQMISGIRNIKVVD